MSAPQGQEITPPQPTPGEVPPPTDPDPYIVETGPALPGLPGHDPGSPRPESLHFIDNEVSRLSGQWFRYPPVWRESRHRGVSLLEAIQYHYTGALMRAHVRALFPDEYDALRQPQQAPPSPSPPDPLSHAGERGSSTALDAAEDTATNEATEQSKTEADR